MRTNINKLVDAGAFNHKSGGGGDKPTTARTTGRSKPTKQKIGAANAVVEEEDDGEEIEVEEDRMPTREYLIQMLGLSNTLVGNVNDTKDPATTSKGCCDGNTLSNIDFTNIQVGGTDRDVNHENQDRGVSFVTKVLKVQGVLGTNPFKAKRKAKTNHKTCDMANSPIIKAEEKPAFLKN